MSSTGAGKLVGGSTRQVRVAIFEPYPVARVGGNLRTLLYMIGQIDRSSFRLCVLAPFETPLAEQIRRHGVEYVVVRPAASVDRYGGTCLRGGVRDRARTVFDLLVYNLRLARLLKQRQVDVVYCNSIRAVLSIGVASRLVGIPVFWYVKGELQNGFLDRVGFLLSSRVAFFCESNRDDKYPRLVRRYRRKIDIVKIGIDSSVVEKVEASDRGGVKADLSIDESKTNIIVLGQLYAPKGVHFALEALSEVVREHRDVMLYIVGDHVIEEYRHYRAELDDLIERRGLVQHVRFTGWRPDAMQVLSLMDILVHPSLTEGFGRAVLEAMALGKAVVASRVGGLREIINDGVNGFLVEPGDAEVIADRLTRLVGDPRLRARLGEAARQEVLAGYQIQDKVRQLEQIWAGMAS